MARPVAGPWRGKHPVRSTPRRRRRRWRPIGASRLSCCPCPGVGNGKHRLPPSPPLPPQGGANKQLPDPNSLFAASVSTRCACRARPEAGRRPRYRKFESISLQERVYCEPGSAAIGSPCEARTKRRAAWSPASIIVDGTASAPRGPGDRTGPTPLPPRSRIYPASMGDIETLLDESIIGHAIRAPITDDFTELFDPRAIDFNKLSAAFRKGQKRTQVQMLRAKVEQKLGEMIRRNPTRADLLEKFQSMIAEYNAGSASVEQLFEQLLDFIRSISEEEQRADREGLDEEELAIFDLLTKPEPNLTRAQEILVKGVARALLAKLKRAKLILDWRLKENAKADVRQTIREEYDDLPEVYDQRIWEDKVERTFQFMFERYPGGFDPPRTVGY